MKTAVLLLGALLFAGCDHRAPPTVANARPQLDPARLLGADAYAETARFVGLGPRPAGSDAAARAAAYLTNRLDAFGLAAETDTFQEETTDGPLTFHNVTATLRGDGQHVIVILSHYDTKIGISPDFVGANDSGSSTGLLLALARALRDRPPQGPDLLLAFVDGEECRRTYSDRDGLHGSTRLATKLAETAGDRPVVAVILLDMIGDRNLSVTIPRNCSPMLVTAAFAGAQAEGVREKFSLFRGEMLDDHVPFLARGMPAIDLIDFDYGSAPGRNDYWHRPADTMDKLSADSLQAVGRVVIRMLNRLSTVAE